MCSKHTCTQNLPEAFGTHSGVNDVIVYSNVTIRPIIPSLLRLQSRIISNRKIIEKILNSLTQISHWTARDRPAYWLTATARQHARPFNSTRYSIRSIGSINANIAHALSLRCLHVQLLHRQMYPTIKNFCAGWTSVWTHLGHCQQTSPALVDLSEDVQRPRCRQPESGQYFPEAAVVAPGASSAQNNCIPSTMFCE